MSKHTKADAARLLSIEESEIHDVAKHDAGTVVVTHDGAKYIIVEQDNPDAEGKHGVMFFEKPSEHYGGTFPVFAGGGDVDVSEPAPRGGDEDSDYAHPGEAEATAEALSAGAPSSDPVPAPGPEHEAAVDEAEADDATSGKRGRKK